VRCRPRSEPVRSLWNTRRARAPLAPRRTVEATAHRPPASWPYTPDFKAMSSPNHAVTALGYARPAASRTRFRKCHCFAISGRLPDGLGYGGPGLVLHLLWVRSDHCGDWWCYFPDEGGELLGGLPLEGDLGLLHLHVREPGRLPAGRPAPAASDGRADRVFPAAGAGFGGAASRLRRPRRGSTLPAGRARVSIAAATRATN
jgi:hypothetical protein